MMMEMETDMAFTHHGGIRLSLNKGDLTTEDIYRSLPFDHKVVKISLTGSQIKKVLEQQWQMDKENLLQPAGVSYSIDHDAQYEGKIHDLIDKDGQKLEPTKVYTVAISNYLALGGDGFSTFKAGKINSTGSYIRDVFLKYIKSQKSDGMPLVQQ
jgi:5'-nucleotidase